MLAPSEHCRMLCVPSPVLGIRGVEVSGTWPLHPPPASKDVDYGRLGLCLCVFLVTLVRDSVALVQPPRLPPSKCPQGCWETLREGGRDSFRPSGPPCVLGLALTHHPHLVLALGSALLEIDPGQRAGAAEGREVAPARVAAVPTPPAREQSHLTKPTQNSQVWGCS